MDASMKGQLSWVWGGVALGGVFVLAIALVQPIGVSTQYVVVDAILGDWIEPSLIEPDPTRASGYRSDNAYLDRDGGKYAAKAAHPLNYGLVFVAAMVFGGFLSRRLGGPRALGSELTVPPVWRRRFGPGRAPRMVVAFSGGFLVLVGARIAGGCTSGHMMSGMVQTAVSGYLFAIAAFTAAIATVTLLYWHPPR